MTCTFMPDTLTSKIETITQTYSTTNFIIFLVALNPPKNRIRNRDWRD